MKGMIHDNSYSYFLSNLKECMEELAEADAELPERDHAFAGSLCAFYLDKGFLSEKQKYWAHKFWSTYVCTSTGTSNAGIEKLPVKKATDYEPGRVTVSPSLITQMLYLAKEKGLKFPSIKYTLPKPIGNVHTIRFYLTGEKSSIPGQVGVNYGEFPNTMQLAILPLNGKTVWMPASLPVPELQQLIKKIAENPLEMLAENGKATSHCCFCSLPLTNASSIHHGYGPICADKYGLPWGDKPADLSHDLGDDIPY